jgi:hypothetical protein
MFFTLKITSLQFEVIIKYKEINYVPVDVVKNIKIVNVMGAIRLFKGLFTDINGYWSCRLLFGSLGFVCCIIAMFLKIDVAYIAILAPTCAGLMGLSALENIKRNNNES